MKKVIGYARVSTQHQDLDRQYNLIKDYCNRNDYQLVKIISEKISGAKEDRQSIIELMQVTKDTTDMVVVSELSRMSREEDIMPVLNNVNILVKEGLDIIFLDKPNKVYEGGKSLSLYEILTIAIEANAAAEEREKIKFRLKTGKDTKLANNPYMNYGGNVPYGYELMDNPEYEFDRAKAKKLIIINYDKMKDVRLIFDMVLEGYTIRDIAKHLNDLGLLTKLNRQFNETSIRKIIRNPMYNGIRRCSGLVLEVEKVIPDDVFNLAGEKLTSNQLFKDKGTKNFNPLKGIAKCPCGYSLMLRKKDNAQDYLIYNCSNKISSRSYSYNCGNKGLSAGYLLKAVWKVTKTTMLLDEYLVKNIAQIDNVRTTIEYLTTNRTSLQQKIEEVILQKESIERAIIAVSLPVLVKKYENEYQSFDRKQVKLEADIKSVESKISIHKEEIRRIESISKEVQLAELTDKEKAGIYKKVLDKVVYYSESNLTGFIVITFKNGIEVIVAVRKSRNGYLSALPSSFNFNRNNKKIVVQVSKKQPNMKSFNLSDIEAVEYNFKELEQAYELKQWDTDELHSPSIKSAITQ